MSLWSGVASGSFDWVGFAPRDRASPARGADPSGVRQYAVAGPSVVGPEVEMANKDKGGKSTKKVAAKDLKHKRLDKKAKKDAAGGKNNKVV